jgi:N6-adenosine-specific RNA methylase IME4
VSVALKALDKLELEITSAPTFDVLDKVANTAAGMQRAFKPVKEVADRAGEVWIAAEEKLAEELEREPKAVGTRGQFIGRAKTEPPKSAPTLAEKGVDKKRAARAKKLRALPKAKKKTYVQQLKDTGKGVTPAAVLAMSRQEAKQEKRHAVQAATFSENGPFDVVVIDPPWQVQKIDRDVRPNQDAFDYPVMTTEQIAQFWKDEIASRIKPDCHLFLWTTQKHLPAAFDLIAGLGFKYVFTMVWHKPGGFQPIDLPQYNCEFIVYARHGVPLFVDTKQFNCCFEAPRREHSRKPDIFYDTVRRVTGGSRIDVFSREQREGFAQYGNEINKFREASE